MGFDELSAEVLNLEPESRATLARDLLESLDALPEEEIERLWIDEAIRREDDLARGTARLVPAAEVMAPARARRR